MQQLFVNLGSHSFNKISPLSLPPLFGEIHLIRIYINKCFNKTFFNCNNNNICFKSKILLAFDLIKVDLHFNYKKIIINYIKIREKRNAYINKLIV